MSNAAGWQEFVATQEVLVAMRFSYFGKSGWQGDASKRKDMLLDPERLTARLAILKSLAIPSLAAQGDQSFHLMILCSEDMPANLLDRLRQVCAEGLKPDQYTICPRPYGRAPKYLTKFLQQRYGLRPVIQTVLDDDDAFARNMIESIRHELGQLSELENPKAMRFVSFADGYGLDIHERSQREFALYSHRYPYLNLGLTMVSSSTGKNLFSIAHQKTPTQHPSRLVKGIPMFVRTLNGLNDSRIAVTSRWKLIDDWRGNPAIAEWFPYLSAI